MSDSAWYGLDRFDLASRDMWATKDLATREQMEKRAVKLVSRSTVPLPGERSGAPIGFSAIFKMVATQTGETTAAQLKAVRGKMDTLDRQRKEATDRQIGQQNELINLQMEEARKASAANITDWMMTVVFVIVAGGATFGAAASGGWALGIAAVGMAFAVTALADKIVQEEKVQVSNAEGETVQLQLNMGGLVDAIVSRMQADGVLVEVTRNGDVYCDKKGHVVLHKDDQGNFRDNDGNVVTVDEFGGKYITEGTLSDWRMGLTIALSLVLAISMMALSSLAVSRSLQAINAASRLGDGAARASRTAQVVEQYGQVFNTVANTIAGITSVGSGISEGMLAQIRKETSRALALKAFYESQVKDIAQRYQLAQEDVAMIMDHFERVFAVLDKGNKLLQETVENTARIINC